MMRESSSLVGPMPYTVNYLKNEDTVEIINVGVFTLIDYIEQTKKALHLGYNNKTNMYLSDNRLLENQARLLDLHRLEAEFKNLNAPRENKLAILLTEDHKDKDILKSFTVLCKSRGWQVRSFMDKFCATKWLASNRPV